MVPGTRFHSLELTHVILVTLSFYRWGNWGSEILSTLLRITHLGRGRARIPHQVDVNVKA